MSSKNNKITILDDNNHINDDDTINNDHDIRISSDEDTDVLVIHNHVHNKSKIDTNNMKKKYTDLMNFINKHKCDYGDKTYTHTWWDNTNKNIIFKVDSSEYEDFLDIYTQEIKINYGNMHVMEKPLDIGPLCLDYDVKLIKGIRCFEKIDVPLVVKSINKIIKKYYNLSDEQEELMCYVLVKNKPYYDENKQLYSDGFHIQYPNLIMDVKDRFVIFEESKNEIINQGYFDEFLKYY